MRYHLPLPPSINATYRAAYRPNLGRTAFFQTKEVRDWKEAARYQLLSEMVKKRGKRISGPVEVFVYFFLKRDRDVDGGLKLVLDSLTGALYQDDSQVVALHAFKEESKEPHCEVEVNPL